ncbi:hypothetical protein LK07_26095 [Streptomyces pluripotens]|uniref:Uncharacterized protein n=1 Tax=Streptomyces pluripotens TaxID=1355015 RepID=A0A221P9E1_9ACTN|nr:MULTISPECIES: hypothetical protein [Streptomyces]ARP74421.1 hypothetical protein LK06_024930 [Streptomyces pluripotens]ASN28696.1 hypothetical protein LK07_26095 [Streptomyces pluripotens]
MVARMVRRGVALGLGMVWWWAVLRLALGEGRGALEGAVTVGGWSLSLLPVHCVPRARAPGALRSGRWRAAWCTAATTRASPRPRSGEVSDPS